MLQIQDQVNRLNVTKDKLAVTWADRKAKLDEMYEQQLFFRDADTLDKISNTQEAQLQNSELGENVDQVEFLIKRHDAFESLLTKQSNKQTSLQETGKSSL